MASPSENGNAYDQEDVSAGVVVFVEKDTHSILLAIAQSVPNRWPTGLNSEREEFSSICIAGMDFERSISAQSTAIILRLRNQAMWRAAKPYQMEMCARKNGSRISPALNVRVDGLKDDGMYTFFLDLMPKAQNIFTYRFGHWTPVQITKPYPPPNHASLIHVNHIALRLGSELMAYGVNFSSAKITSDASAPVDRNQIFVHRRQVYLPRFHIVRHLAAEEVDLIQQSEGGCRNEALAYYEHIGTYIIPERSLSSIECLSAVGLVCSRSVSYWQKRPQGYGMPKIAM
eukprot:TsM_001203500 transcript=TsM_001203500 gene=TsM_001203500